MSTGDRAFLYPIVAPIGPALLAEITDPIHPIEAPEGLGLIFWGRSDRATFGQLLLSSKAAWIADYDIRRKVAVVMWPPELAGKEMAIDTTCVDPTCPSCGSTNHVSNGGKMWKCSDCGRQWSKSGNRRGGSRPGAGRKSINRNGDLFVIKPTCPADPIAPHRNGALTDDRSAQN